MNEAYKQAYGQLNPRQRQAVDTTDGPVMVLAGPGTGKTQLLTTRAAHIAASGNTNASNILCLTYTESGATEMRERLIRIMGPSGNDVAVYTFHGFGSLLISQYPENFSAQRSLQPLDELGRFRIFEKLLAALPLRHPLAVRGDEEQFMRRHAVEEITRAFKQAGMAPEELRHIIKDNEAEMTVLQPVLDDLFGSTLSAKRLPAIHQTVSKKLAAAKPASLAGILLKGLHAAVEESIELGKTRPIGAWRDKFTVIKNGARIFKSAAQSQLLSDSVTLYEKYQKQLQAEGRFDYEDMILWASQSLEKHTDMLLDVAERYQYVMVDEYQDTNGAQNRLLDILLQANPLNSPNIMVVGDDDQAIMRFQGAELSGMVHFTKKYQPKVVVLDVNYRSNQKIIDASRQIIAQSDERLEVVLPELGISKNLVAHTQNQKGIVEHYSYDSSGLQYAGIAQHIGDLLKTGVDAQQIAVIGRKHRELADVVPFLTNAGITTNYDRHENILEHPLILDLIRLARYTTVLPKKPTRAAALLPDVLAASYWGLPPLALYQIAATARLNNKSWLDVLLESDDASWQAIAEWLVAAATACSTSNFTQSLDILIGRQSLDNTQLGNSSYGKYISTNSRAQLDVLSHLICMRRAVLEAHPSARGLDDMLEVVKEYQLSGLRLIDRNPILHGDSNGVQVMSAHSSKGREFEHVILVSAVDSVWGAKARGQTQRIRLPENLPLYPAGDSESDRLRLLYVAMTRAKSHVLLSSYNASDEGTSAAPLSYIQFGSQNGWWQPQPIVIINAKSILTLETTWRPHDTLPERPYHEVLEPILKNYRLSASALRTFLDIRYAGPKACIEQSVLKFPSAYNAHSALGSATHKTLEAAYAAYKASKPLSTATLLKVFDSALEASGLTSLELEPVRVYGHQFLPTFVAKFSASDFPKITSSEQFATALLPDVDVPISGAIDAIAKDENGLVVIDYKTGRPPQHEWKTAGLSDSKKVSLHFYRQQLIFYKLLLDHSRATDGTVTRAQLVFVEPSENSLSGDIIRLKIDEFDEAQILQTKQLIAAIYGCLMRGDIPDISPYTKDLKGVLRFEADLLSRHP